MSIENQPDEMRAFQSRFDALSENIGRFIQGKRDTVRSALICLFAEGHLLIEDVPGVAKTSLARAIAQSISADVRRIQFTPDLLPTDITGVRVWSPKDLSFRFEEGPVFANLVIADEINRASPKTQSALLEVMAERQVTIDGQPREVPRPFLCVATQNPFDHRGTYALPEAQLDRFTMRIGMGGYPSVEEEMGIIEKGRRGETPDTLEPVMSVKEMVPLFRHVRKVRSAPEVDRYIAQLVHATRRNDDLALGASPRGSIALAMCAQVHAAAEGRAYTTVDDVKQLAVAVLAHRVVMSPSAHPDQTPEKVIHRILTKLPASPGTPRGKHGSRA